MADPSAGSDTLEPMAERNLLGGTLEPCGADPVTGYFRDEHCRCGDPATGEDPGLHAVCAVMTEEFLAHQRATGNDLLTPRPEWGFPGLKPGDRWCVVAARWLMAYQHGVPAPVVLAATSERALEVVPMQALHAVAVDVPADPRDLA